jgi:AcrR family transcriptional regulator
MLPGVAYTREFTSLAQARAHFGVTTASSATRATRASRAHELKAEGRTIQEIADALGVSRSTVKRYLGSKMNINNYGKGK